MTGNIVRSGLIALAGLALAQCSEGQRPAAEPENGAAPKAQAQAAPPAPAPARAGDSATLVPFADGDIAIPRVTGIDAGAARRIEAALERERARYRRWNGECRSLAAEADAEGAVEVEAIAAYNAHRLLSLRLEGLAFCGGANGSPIHDAMTFDLRTGERIDVAAATGLPRDELAALARPFYPAGECAEPLGLAGGADFKTAYLDRGGLAVLYSFNSGATEACSLTPAVIPVETARARTRIDERVPGAWGGR
jgi:hypothetical protein